MAESGDDNPLRRSTDIYWKRHVVGVRHIKAADDRQSMDDVVNEAVVKR